MRFGLLGTGFWAAETQAAALAGHPGAEFVGVWGRNPAKASDLAARYGLRAYDNADIRHEIHAPVWNDKDPVGELNGVTLNNWRWT